MYVTLFHRSDRLGANITLYIAQILFAIHYGLYIHYDRTKLKYNKSIFVQALFDFIDIHNKSYILQGEDIKWEDPGDWVTTISNTVKHIQCDMVSYFKERVFATVQLNFYSIAIHKKYSIPFDYKKTIMIHLRLEDVAGVADYDGRVCANYYRGKIEKDELCVCEGLEMNRYNRQAPLAAYKLEEQIAKIKEVHKDYTVRIVTSPGSTIDMLYECISSDDESYDLFLLSMCDIIILSRSTYSLSSLYFGNYTKAYVPLWGHAACMGLYTKYDKSQLNYFY